MRRYLKFIILTLVAALVLWWFARGLDWASVRAAIGKSDWRLIALAVVFVWTTYFIRALRWRALLAPITEASLRELFAATTIGFSTLFLLGRAGEAVVRPAFLSLRDRRVRPAAAFVTIGVERLYDMVAVVVLFAVNLIWFRAPGGGDPAAYARVRQAGIVLLVAAAVGIAALVVAIFVVIALAFSIVLIPVSRRAKRVQTRLDEEFGDSTERSANVSSLGLQSRGRGQVRGNGRLVLTPDELRFRQWIPQHETTIPIAAVTSVGTERTWLGKWVGSKLLCVRWRASDGSEDAMAWQVPDLEGWLAALNAHRNQSSA